MYQVRKGSEKMYQLLPLVGEDTVPSLLCLIQEKCGCSTLDRTKRSKLELHEDQKNKKERF